MSRLAQAVAIHVVSQSLSPRLGLWTRLGRHLRALTAAHARQARFAHLDGSEARDTGLPPEDFMGEANHDPALPFFLQSGFDRRD